VKFIVLEIKLFAKLESTAERRHKYYSFGRTGAGKKPKPRDHASWTAKNRRQYFNSL